MGKKFIVFSLLMFSLTMFVPASTAAASGNAVETPQIRVLFGRRRDRRRREWRNRRRVYVYNSYPRYRRRYRRTYRTNNRRVRVYRNY
jgi:hypothetical protein